MKNWFRRRHRDHPEESLLPAQETGPPNPNGKAPPVYPVSLTFHLQSREEAARFIDGLIYGWGSVQLKWDPQLRPHECEEFDVDLLL